MELTLDRIKPSPVISSRNPRRFKKLRVSITDNCNLSCVYCDEPKKSLNLNSSPGANTDVLKLAEIVASLHRELDLSSVRITGGEPTLNPNLTAFVRLLKEAGIPEVNLTTNGLLLESRLDELQKAGLDRINVSLDALDDDTFANMTGYRGVSRVTHSIVRAKEAGFDVKINAIIMRGFNENQVLPLLEFAMGIGVKIRFLELMKMGVAVGRHNQQYYSCGEILLQIKARYEIGELPREVSSTARYYQIGREYRFGVIANHSEPFCSDCDRLRLDHRGRLYGCLSNPASFDISSLDEPLAETLVKAMAMKQKDTFAGSNLSMRHIGG